MRNVFLVLTVLVALGVSACATQPSTDNKRPVVKPSIRSKAIPKIPVKQVWIPGGWNEGGVWVPGHWEAK